MSNPTPAPSLEDLARLVGELAPQMQWLTGMHSVTAKAVQDAHGEFGGQRMTDAQAGQVAWRVFSALGAYLLPVDTGVPASEQAPADEQLTFDDD